MKKLTPTADMIRRANADKPEKIKRKWSIGSYDRYKCTFYIRCCTQDGIMKVAIFKTANIRLCSKKPVCEIFLDKENMDFISYDYIHEKWTNAMIDNMQFLCSEYEYWCIHSDDVYSSRETNKKIKSFLGVSNGNVDGIRDFQYKVRSKQLEIKHKKETDPWDEIQKLVPALPKDWERWVLRTAIKQHFIFYTYQRNVKEGYCTRCNKAVPLKNPKYNAIGKCPCCGATVTFKSDGKAGKICTERETAYLMQKTANGFVIRQFDVWMTIENGQYYRKPKADWYETRRVFYKEDFRPQAFYYGFYKQKEFRWIEAYAISKYGYYPHSGMVYRKSIAPLKNMLSRTGFIEVVKNRSFIDPEVYFAGLSQRPYIEQLAKAGLTELAWECAADGSYSANEKYAIQSKGEIHKMLGINKDEFKRMQRNNCKHSFLIWLRYEKERNKHIDDAVIKWLVNNNVQPRDIVFISDRMSERQICRYLQKQVALSGDSIHQVLNTWQDYLIMAKRAKYNITLSMIYAPRDLDVKHNELVEKLGSADTAKTANEIAGKYPGIDDICSLIKDKFEFKGDTYSVLVPSRIEDIIEDSNTLNHCVASTPDRYFGRMHKHESYILFLRKTSALAEPFYTLEVEPNGTVRQTRTKFNKQGNDINEIKAFLSKWQKEISKRLSADDIKRGQLSNAIRLKEYGELKEQKVTINRGDYKGKLLADVLESDLLINKGLVVNA